MGFRIRFVNREKNEIEEDIIHPEKIEDLSKILSYYDIELMDLISIHIINEAES